MLLNVSSTSLTLYFLNFFRSPIVEMKVKEAEDTEGKSDLKEEKEKLMTNVQNKGSNISNDKGTDQEIFQHQYQPSLTKTFIRAIGPYYIVGNLFKILHDLVIFISPYILR